MCEVSIIVPCYNEEAHIQDLLSALKQQTFPSEKMEVIIADGKSDDETLTKIDEFVKNNLHPSIVVIENEKRNIPTALNRALEKSRGDIIIRMDAHSIPYPDYVEKCVKALEDGRGDNVGGLWIIKPGNDSFIAESIAAAASHPLGVGDAKYRYSQKADYVDTVPFGAYHRNLIQKIGPYDETLLANEDYEFNVRIRNSGGKIFFDPEIKNNYVSRSSITELAKQYWRYGFWKYKMLLKHPDTLRYRQALPPLFVVSLLFLLILSIFFNFMRYFLISEILVYLLVLVIASVPIAIKHNKPGFIFGIPLAIITMHFSWGSGFLSSILFRG